MDSLDHFQALRRELLGPLRDEDLSERELRLVSIMQRGGPQEFSLYGMNIEALASTGMQVLGRTVLECMSDEECMTVLNTLTRPQTSEGIPGAFELFCGSGNFTYHLSQTALYRCFASEASPAVYSATAGNLKRLACEASVENIEWIDLISKHTPHTDQDLFILDPPWGAAFSSEGLNLTQTTPAVDKVLDTARQFRRGVPFRALVKGNDVVTEDSLSLILKMGKLVDMVGIPTGPKGMNSVYWLLRII